MFPAVWCSSMMIKIGIFFCKHVILGILIIRNESKIFDVILTLCIRQARYILHPHSMTCSSALYSDIFFMLHKITLNINLKSTSLPDTLSYVFWRFNFASAFFETIRLHANGRETHLVIDCHLYVSHITATL